MTTCTKCGRETTSADGVCGNRARAECERLAAKAQKSAVGSVPKSTASAEERGDMKPPPRPKKEKTPPSPPGDVEEFFTLAGALGLDAQKMLDEWCRQWVAKVRARALSAKPSADAPPEVAES